MILGLQPTFSCRVPVFCLQKSLHPMDPPHIFSFLLHPPFSEMTCDSLFRRYCYAIVNNKHVLYYCSKVQRLESFCCEFLKFHDLHYTPPCFLYLIIDLTFRCTAVLTGIPIFRWKLLLCHCSAGLQYSELLYCCTAVAAVPLTKLDDFVYG